MKYAALVMTLLCITAGGMGQNASPALESTNGLKDVVVSFDQASSSTIVVPPVDGVKVVLQATLPSRDRSLDLVSWLRTVTAMNGLASTDVKPWRIVVTYDQFDSDGDNSDSGIYEELWAGPKKYKRTFKSGTFEQTEYGTERGLLRIGSPQWPEATELQVRAAILDPFAYASSVPRARAGKIERVFGTSKLDCVFLDVNPGMKISDPPQYCFEPGGSVLRYSRADGWFQTAYNRVVTFQGRNVAREVVITDGSQPYLKLHVETLESTPNVSDADFLPPPNAAGPIGKRVTGVHPRLIKFESPAWPTSSRGQHLKVQMEIVIGKNGRVLSAHAVSGAAELYAACEKAARKLEFAPFLVLGKPVEVETKFEFTQN